MASCYKEIVTRAIPSLVWDAIRDVGQLHTRLVPGFVVDTRLEPGQRDQDPVTRVVTFANGMVIREPIITLDEGTHRLVWTARGGMLTHYNASVQVFPEGQGSRVIWIADFLPDEAKSTVDAMMDSGMSAMSKALDKLAP